MCCDIQFGGAKNNGDKRGVVIENDHIYGIRSDKIQPYSRTFYGPQYYGFDAPQRMNIRTMEDLTDKTLDWLSVQKKETPFFLYFAPVAVHHPITPSNFMRGMSDCGPYGDFIQDLDWSVGRIIQLLEYKGLMDNTIIIFTSDNGGDIPTRPEAPEVQAIDAGLKINGELRGDKHTIWEGGTRVPFIVSWPGHVSEGSVCDDIVGVVDVFATVADVTGTGLPDDLEVAPDSYSFYDALMGQKKRSPRESIITADANGLLSIRMGDWKLIDNKLPESFPEERKGRIESALQYQLYNLADDPAETNNVYDENPEVVKKLTKEFNRIREQESSR